MTAGLGRFLRHNIIALLALFLALGGTSFAAASLINGRQIKPHTIAKNRLTNAAVHQLKGNRGARGATGAPGAPGAQGPQGIQGVQGLQGPQGIVSTTIFNGPGVTVPPGAFYVFVGTTATVTTAAGQSLVGAAELPLIASAATPVDFGLCYQPSAGGTVNNFVSHYSTTSVQTTSSPFSASAAVAPGAGSWKVGFCVRNDYGSATISTDWVNGWVQVVNGTLSGTSGPVTAKPAS
jgi:hypothetical protein